MRSTSKRLDAVASSLSPTQVVVLWMVSRKPVVLFTFPKHIPGGGIERPNGVFGIQFRGVANRHEEPVPKINNLSAMLCRPL